MPNTNAAIKAQLAVLQAQIAGVSRAFPQAPNSISAADAPCFVNLEGAGQDDDDKYGPGTYQVIRDYRMILFVAPRGAGVPGEVAGLAEPFIDAVKDFFVSRPQLGGVAGVQRAKITGDGGVVGLKYQDDDWVGIEFTLNVEYIVAYEYAAVE